MARLRQPDPGPEPAEVGWRDALAFVRAAKWPSVTGDGPRPPVLCVAPPPRGAEWTFVADGCPLSAEDAVALVDAWLTELGQRPGFERFRSWCTTTMERLAAARREAEHRPERRAR